MVEPSGAMTEETNQLHSALVEPVTRLVVNSVSCVPAFCQYAASAYSIPDEPATNNGLSAYRQICRPILGRCAS